jgi:hypothetical protein
VGTTGNETGCTLLSILPLLDFPDINLFNSVQVIDLTGKTVLHTNIDKNITNLNVSHLQNGVYLVRATGKGGIKTQKLIISR